MPIETEEALRELYPAQSKIVRMKYLPAIDEHIAKFIALSPFLVIGSNYPDSGTDVSPRGEAPGFVQVVDENTVMILDRPFRRAERTFADFGDLALVFDPENAEDGIADEFENLAAMGMSRAGHCFEIVVQYRDQEIKRDTVRQAGEPVQVAHPQIRIDRLAVAALDIAGVDLAPRLMAEIKIEQAFRHFGVGL